MCPIFSINRVRLGQHLAITTDAFPQAFAGRVSAISPAADPKSRVFSVEVTIPNSARSAEIGNDRVARAEWQRNCRKRVLAIPSVRGHSQSEALANGFAVMIAEGGGDRDRTPAGRRTGGYLRKYDCREGGLNSGESVITTGVDLIKSGDKVRV